MELSQNIKLAVDIVLFGYEQNQLFILLIKQKYGKYKGKWSLPGGFVKDTEGITEAAIRELKEETGIVVSNIEQLYTFGDDIKRDHRHRVVSIAYFGTIIPSKMKLTASTDAMDAKWFVIDEIKDLPYDHNQIIELAYHRLRSKLNYQPIGFNLLNKKFPFSDLENLYMTILQKKIDRRNFRKKILSFDFLEETDEIVRKGSGRPATLYKFNQAKYKQSVKRGINFEIKYA
jgi:8-oxo-dGTP diphosphatase